MAVLTRNARRWSEVVLQKFGIEVDALCTRDDGVIKPSPSPVFELCHQAGRAASASWLVGDHLSFADLAVIGQLNALLYAEEARAALEGKNNISAWIERLDAVAPR